MHQLRLATTSALCIVALLHNGPTFAQAPPSQQRSQQQPAAGVPRQAAVPGRAPQVAPAPPFTLTPQEQQQLVQVLQAWENQSKQIRTFTAEFQREEYDAVFNSKKTSQGVVKYQQPDKGVYQIEGDEGEHWICDGKSIYEYDRQRRLVIERKLPQELQGKAIVDGPLPFIFGADANKLQARYFLRISPAATAEEAQRRQQASEIWLEAYPRFQRDAANFRRADVILRGEQMLPYAIRVYLPNGQKTTDHIFKDNGISVNGFWDVVNDIKPRVPFGWKMVLEEPARQPPANSGTAQRPATGNSATPR